MVRHGTISSLLSPHGLSKRMKLQWPSSFNMASQPHLFTHTLPKMLCYQILDKLKIYIAIIFRVLTSRIIQLPSDSNFEFQLALRILPTQSGSIIQQGSYNTEKVLWPDTRAKCWRSSPPRNGHPGHRKKLAAPRASAPAATSCLQRTACRPGTGSPHQQLGQPGCAPKPPKFWAATETQQYPLPPSNPTSFTVRAGHTAEEKNSHQAL